jgi:hypothetical protein
LQAIRNCIKLAGNFRDLHGRDARIACSRMPN